MDAWIVGRQSEPLHVWARYCRGRDGIDRITGLPRSLVDLISLTSRGEDVTEQLGHFIQRLPGSPAAAEDLWRCYALTGMLYLRRVEDDGRATADLRNEVSALISRLSEDPEYSESSVLAWPAYTLGCHGQDDGTRTLVEHVLARTIALQDACSSSIWTPLNAMQKFWQRSSSSGWGEGGADTDAFEVGLW